MAVWAGGSAALEAGNFRPHWSMEAGPADALDRAGRPAKTCGLAPYRPRGTVAGSHAPYRRAPPLSGLTSPEAAARRTPAFVVVLTRGWDVPRVGSACVCWFRSRTSA